MGMKNTTNTVIINEAVIDGAAASGAPYYEERRGKLYDWMESEDVALVMFEDCEARRNSSIRYLCGHPSDALLFLDAVNRKSLLVPWDKNLAFLCASVDALVPYTEFKMQPLLALRGAIDFLKTPYHSKIEIPPVTSYPDFLAYSGEISDYDILCSEGEYQTFVDKCRAVKDELEIKIYKECAELTNALIAEIVHAVVCGTLKTETDVALFIEAECRRRGCEGTGFGTLAAGTDRSFAIHCFPGFTNAPFAGQGFSILDFGIVWQGYTSDVTLTFARNLSKPQDRMLHLVEKAHNAVISTLKNAAASGAFLDDTSTDDAFAGDAAGAVGGKNITTQELALLVSAIFDKAKLSMPHGLGHGIGLDAHEGPYLRVGEKYNEPLKAGMIFTVEPGLYDPVLGGCRLENDVLLENNKALVLTKSAIVRL
jgi:Xaa-Pro dipeptidase